MMFYHDGGMGWWMVFGGIWMMVFWAIIIGLAVWGIRKLAEHDEPRSTRTHESTPLEVAKVRYARGEISKEEFEQIKRDLSL